MLHETLATLEAAGIPAVAQTRFGEPAIRIETGNEILVVSLLGAQVLEWSPGGGTSPLWLTRETLHKPGSPIRGGIPVCWPWFGAAHPPFDGPGHGFARRRHWKLMSAMKQHDSVSLHWQLEISGEGYRLLADYHVRAGRVLALQLATTHLGTGPCPVTPAFHPYFAVSDLSQTRIRFPAALQPFDRLTREHREATETFVFDGEETEVQWTPWTDLEVECGGNVRLRISSDSATHCVAWNPGPEKTRCMGDLHADAFNRFVCIEPGRLDQSAAIRPGEKTVISMVVSRL